jgi:hypothetical protein
MRSRKTDFAGVARHQRLDAEFHLHTCTGREVSAQGRGTFSLYPPGPRCLGLRGGQHVRNRQRVDFWKCGDLRWRAVPVINTAISQMTDGPRKIVLPRRPGEPRFAPPQYYYPASRTGVLPCWRAGT